MPIINSVIKGKQPVIDTLNVTPTTSAQQITAPQGTDGYSPVNVSAVTSSIDANIVSGNIKDGVTILGVTGDYQGQVPSGTKTITSNGVTDVSGYANADVQVPTTAPAFYREFELDGTGKLIPNTTTTHIMDFTGVHNVYDYALAFAYYNNTAISGAVNMSSLTTISGQYACNYMFRNCTGLTSANLSGLTTISGQYACYNMFRNCAGLTSANLSSFTTASGTNACRYMFAGCSGLTSIDLSSLTTVSGGAACQYMFQNCSNLTSVDLSGLTIASANDACGNMFGACVGLTSVDLSSLSTISGNNACGNMFAGCTGLTSIDLSSLTTISSSQACYNMFNGCTSLATVYIGGTTAIDFGTQTNQFNSMFNGCTQNIDVYAPAASQSAIEGLTGYPNFSGTGTVTWHWRS